MEGSAIQLIQNTAIEAAQGRAAELLQGKQIALPDGYRIHDLEQFQAGRRRFRGTLRTDSLSDFTGYVRRRAEHREGPAPGFIKAESLSANVVFNLGDVSAPGHADDQAILTLKPSAPYASMLAVDGLHLPQKDALDWLEDWSDQVKFVDADGEAMAAGAAITALRKITIRATAESTTSQDQYRATRSAMEDVEARGAQQLPAEVRFTCTPCPGLPDRTFRLRVGVLTNSEKPILTLRVRNLAAEQEAIAQDFKRVLLEDLQEAAVLTIGTFTA